MVHINDMRKNWDEAKCRRALVRAERQVVKAEGWGKTELFFAKEWRDALLARIAELKANG